MVGKTSGESGPLTKRECGAQGCAQAAEFYWHDAGPFGAGTFYGCAEHAPRDAVARAEQSGHPHPEHTFGPGFTDPGHSGGDAQ